MRETIVTIINVQLLFINIYYISFLVKMDYIQLNIHIIFFYFLMLYIIDYYI